MGSYIYRSGCCTLTEKERGGGREKEMKSKVVELKSGQLGQIVLTEAEREREYVIYKCSAVELQSGLKCGLQGMSMCTWKLL